MRKLNTNYSTSLRTYTLFLKLKQIPLYSNKIPLIKGIARVFTDLGTWVRFCAPPPPSPDQGAKFNIDI
jgi:hypothetical protein